MAVPGVWLFSGMLGDTACVAASIISGLWLIVHLAIRSSRLPVIMDQAEKRFNIVIRIEDFIGVNTVRDMATRIDALRAQYFADLDRLAPAGWPEAVADFGRAHSASRRR